MQSLKAFIKKLYSFLYFHSWRLGLWVPPDRKLLNDVIVPYILASEGTSPILFVGVQDYCKRTLDLLSTRPLWTVDPEATHFPNIQHFECKLNELPSRLPRVPFFQTIILNGVIGYGINSVQEIKEAIANINRITLDNSLIVIGFNPEISETAWSEIQQSETLSNWEAFKWPVLQSNFYRVKFPFLSNFHHDYYFFRKVR